MVHGNEKHNKDELKHKMEVGETFLKSNSKLLNIEIPNPKKINDNFLHSDIQLEKS